MNLNIQLYSFICSFLYGVVFYFFLNIFNKIVIKMNVIFRFVLSFVYIILMSSLYFIMLLFVNNGVVHIYFLLLILVGYMIAYLFSVKLFTHLKKK